MLAGRDPLLSQVRVQAKSGGLFLFSGANRAADRLPTQPPAESFLSFELGTNLSKKVSKEQLSFQPKVGAGSEVRMEHPGLPIKSLPRLRFGSPDKVYTLAESRHADNL